MNLATLPNSLIAHIAGYMDYSDVRNLMKTNKRIYSAIKYYGKDKMSPDHLVFSSEDDIFACVSYGEARGGFKGWTIRKSYTFENGRLSENIEDNIAHILNECSYIRSMEFFELPVDSDILKMLIASTAKIGSIAFTFAYMHCSAEELITVSQKYGKCSIATFSYVPENFWIDEVFVKVIPHVDLDNFPDDEDLWNCGRRGLTDVALMAVFKHCRIFQIPREMTSFTVEGIVKGLQMRSNCEKREFIFQLGVLDSSQLDIANHYFDVDTGELKDKFEISVSEYYTTGHYAFRQRNYKLEFRDPKNNSCIHFSVLKPIE